MPPEQVASALCRQLYFALVWKALSADPQLSHIDLILRASRASGLEAVSRIITSSIVSQSFVIMAFLAECHHKRSGAVVSVLGS